MTLGKPLQVHKESYLNDCRFCIYFGFCCSVKVGRGKLAEKGCMITNWENPNREDFIRKSEMIRRKIEESEQKP